MRTKLFAFIILSIIALSGFLVWKHGEAEAPSQPKTQPSSSARFDKTLYSRSDPASIWVVVNKQHALSPKDYAPSDLVTPNVSLRVPDNESMQLRQAAATAVEQMFGAANADGAAMTLSSGYRSYTYQVNLYSGYVAAEGQAEADTQSARPGFSEHQTGLAVDVEPLDRSCELEACFGDTVAGKWVQAHAHEYGFIIRYLSGKESTTGYEPEPWHLRYVGKELATEMQRSGVTTLEEFFDISGGKNYAN